MRKILLVMMLTLPVIGCGTTEILCSETVDLRSTHRAALIADGGDRSVVSGAILLKTMEDYCGPRLPLGL